MTDEEEVQRLLADFREKAAPLGVIVGRVGSEAEAARAIVNWAEALGAESAVVAAEVTQRAPTIPAALEALGLRIQQPASPEATRDTPLGISLGRLAVAETGSVLLSESSLEDRSVGMLTLAQVTLCQVSALVSSLDDAAPVLRQLSRGMGGAFSTLVTGPSRTADIERVLTVGVQGPGKVMTLFVDDL